MDPIAVVSKAVNSTFPLTQMLFVYWRRPSLSELPSPCAVAFRQSTVAGSASLPGRPAETAASYSWSMNLSSLPMKPAVRILR